MPMGRAGTELLDGGEMGGRGVAFVAVEAIGRVVFMQLAEESIAMNFCQDGGGGDGNDFEIALGETLLGQIE